MSELLPCPFCGGPAFFHEGRDDDGRFVAVGCMCGGGTGKHYPLKDDARPAAANEWNRRAPSPEPAQREVEWLSIETAPKDVTHILAYRLPNAIRFTNLTNPPTVVHWFNDPEAPGFYTSVNEVAPERPFDPTHWMPLPPPPPASATTSPTPGAERVIGEAEAVVTSGFTSVAGHYFNYLKSGDRLTVFERDGKLFVQFSDEREV